MKFKQLFVISLLAITVGFIGFKAEAKKPQKGKRPDFVESKIQKAKMKKQEAKSKAEKEVDEAEDKIKKENERVNKNAQKHYEKANKKVEKMKEKGHKKFDENPSLKAHQKRVKKWWEFWKSDENN